MLPQALSLLLPSLRTGCRGQRGTRCSIKCRSCSATSTWLCSGCLSRGSIALRVACAAEYAKQEKTMTANSEIFLNVVPSPSALRISAGTMSKDKASLTAFLLHSDVQRPAPHRKAHRHCDRPLYGWGAIRQGHKGQEVRHRPNRRCGGSQRLDQGAHYRRKVKACSSGSASEGSSACHSSGLSFIIRSS